MTAQDRNRETDGNFPPDLARRWLLYGLLALGGGEILFALITGILDNYGPVGDIGGHLPTLVGLGAVVYLAQRRALKLAAHWQGAVLSGVCTVIAYVGAFTVIGPPFDFLLSLVTIGLVTGGLLFYSMRRTVRAAAWCAVAVVVGYSVGAVVGVGAAVVAGDLVNRVFGGGVTGFMGVVGMIGLLAAAVGSALSGLALSRLLVPAQPSGHPQVRTES